MTPTHGPTDAERAALRQLVGEAILLHGDGSTHTLVALTDAQCDALLALLAGLRARLVTIHKLGALEGPVYCDKPDCVLAAM